MREDSSPLRTGPRLLTRRAALLLAGAGVASFGRLGATTADFWDKKPPSQWSSEEIQRLMNKSPWAKEVNAKLAPGEGPGGYGNGSPNGGGYPGGGSSGGGMGQPRIGLGIPGIGGIGMPRGGMGGGRRGNGGGGGRRQGDSTYEKGTVRWESAQPIIEAVKTPLPEAFKNHYVISVSGIPLRSDRPRSSDSEGSQGSDDDNPRQSKRSEDDTLDQVKAFTTLQAKGKDLVGAGVVERQASSYSSFLFGFSKEMLQLTKNDKELEFSTKLGHLLVKAKFEPREMMYRKELAL